MLDLGKAVHAGLKTSLKRRFKSGSDKVDFSDIGLTREYVTVDPCVSVPDFQ